MPADGATAPPDPGRTRVAQHGQLLVFRDGAADFLGNAATGEVVRLRRVAAGQEPVVLDYDDEGDGFLVLGAGQVSWAAEFLQYEMHSVGAKLFVVKGDTRRWLTEHFNEHTECTVGLRTMDHNRRREFRIAKFARSLVGVHLWWSFESIWEFAGFRFSSAKAMPAHTLAQLRRPPVSIASATSTLSAAAASWHWFAGCRLAANARAVACSADTTASPPSTPSPPWSSG